jgi:1-acyl-sn-glycerol-3-phosphate acyltransferase
MGDGAATRADPESRVTVPVPNYGLDTDRVLATDSLPAALRRRLRGQYAVDEFGADPHLMDLTAGLVALPVTVEHGEHVPQVGPALLVANRGLGFLEPLAVVRAVHVACGRRARVVGAPEVPVLGDALRKLGAIGYRPDDVAALLRAGNVAAAPLASTWFRSGPGEPPRALLVATLGFPVLPVAVQPGFPFGRPGRPWRVRFGEPLFPPAGTGPDDQLAAAELAAEVQTRVQALLEDRA